MAAMDPMAYELLVNAAAANLPPAFFDDFRRLARELQANQGRWGLFMLQYEHTDARKQVSEAIQTLVKRAAVVHVDAVAHSDWMRLEAVLAEAAKSADVILLQDLDAWLDSHPDPSVAARRMRAWNIRRDGFAKDVPVPVLCWLRPLTMKTLATTAPDLWSWRASVNRFVGAEEGDMAPMALPMTEHHVNFDNRTVAQRTKRIHDIQQYFAENPTPTDVDLPLRGSLLEELAALLKSIGELDEALRIYREALFPLYRQLGDDLGKMSVRGDIAGVLQERGEFDEALHICRDELLPAFQRLGDERIKARILGEIVNILTVRGEFDEALRICEEEVIPLYKQLDDSRWQAITFGQIANLFKMRGEFDEVMRINKDVLLPMFQQSGELRAAAVAKGNIAEVLYLRREFDEALRLYREDVLPVFQKLGDVHARALALVRVAAILTARGEFDEASRIYREEIAPAFERFGDAGNLTIIRVNLVHLLIHRADAGDLDEAKQLLTLALNDAQRLGLPTVPHIEKMLAALPSAQHHFSRPQDHV
jgi:tetratricopeptide (TPR) repeat protein